ncbi:MAG: D-alanyl-D-alanine carboxypeptidase, partial [Pseudomonadota bacterium]
ASDLVRLAKAIARRHPEKYARYIGQPGFRYNNIGQDNRDPMIGRVEGADGLKTGYTNESGLGYLGSADRQGQRLVVVVAGANRNDTRSDAAIGLIEWGFGAFERVQVAHEGRSVGTARVQNGSARSVGLKTARPVFVNVPRGQEDQVEVKIAYSGPLRAPIVEGAAIATLLVSVSEGEPARIPLLATEDVREADFLARLWNGLAGWFS